MPAWLHERARHLQSKNSDMPTGQAFAIATQQSHKLNKTPKNYGTSEGRAVAKAKYQLPRRAYRKTAGRVKKANVALGLGPGASAQVQPPLPVPAPSVQLGQANPLTAAQAPPKMPPPIGIAPAQTGPMPTAASGPATLPKTSSATRYQAFFDELHSITKEAWDTRLLHPRFAGQRATGLLKAVRGAAKKVGFKETPFVAPSAKPKGRVERHILKRKKRSREDIFQTLSGVPDPLIA